MQLKVGVLARRSGLTVRTLHHYDDIGLLKPSARSDAGYRLYNHKDVARLQQIQALRSLGVPLADIGVILDRQDLPFSAVLDQQIQLLDRQITQQTRLRDRLALLQRQCNAGREPELADWLDALELMSMYERYFSEDELARMPFYQRDQASDGVWRELAGSARVLVEGGKGPESEAAQQLACRWMEQLQQDTAADPKLFERLQAMHAAEPSMQAQTGIEHSLSEFMLRAFAESKLVVYQRYLNAEEYAFMRANYLTSMRQWPALIAQLREAQAQGLDPAEPGVQQLAARWLELFQAYASENPVTQQKIRLANQQEPSLARGTWVDSDLLSYLGKAVTAVTKLG